MFSKSSGLLKTHKQFQNSNIKISGNWLYSKYKKKFPAKNYTKFKKIEDEPFYTQKEIDRTQNLGSSSSVNYTKNYWTYITSIVISLKEKLNSSK
jgi:hypothetical protein